MKLDKKIAGLISQLEAIVGGNCYNGSSYNGWTREYGSSFRYPVKYVTGEKDNHTWEKTRNQIDETPLAVETATYQFGANELFIGKALVDVLKDLERRYGLDFNKMENQYQENLKKERQEEKKDDKYTRAVIKFLKSQKFRILDDIGHKIYATKDGEAYYINTARRIENTDEKVIAKIGDYATASYSTFCNTDIGDGIPDHVWNVINFQLPPELETLAKEKNIDIVYFDNES